MNISKILLISITLFIITSCTDEKTKTVEQPSQPIKTVDKQKASSLAITQKEVSRIALVEAKQNLDAVNKSNLDTEKATKTYKQAQASYDKGDYKRAQVLAVRTRRLLEKHTR